MIAHFLNRHEIYGSNIRQLQLLFQLDVVVVFLSSVDWY